MSKYLEKIDRVISDANVVKSFSFPYVVAVDDENGYIYLGYRGNSSTSTSTLLFQIG